MKEESYIFFSKWSHLMAEYFTVLIANESFWRSVALECTSRIFCLLFQNKSCFVPLPLTLPSRSHRYNMVHLNLRKHTEQNDFSQKELISLLQLTIDLH